MVMLLKIQQQLQNGSKILAVGIAVLIVLIPAIHIWSYFSMKSKFWKIIGAQRSVSHLREAVIFDLIVIFTLIFRCIKGHYPRVRIYLIPILYQFIHSFFAPYLSLSKYSQKQYMDLLRITLATNVTDEANKIIQDYLGTDNSNKYFEVFIQKMSFTFDKILTAYSTVILSLLIIFIGSLFLHVEIYNANVGMKVFSIFEFRKKPKFKHEDLVFHPDEKISEKNN